MKRNLLVFMGLLIPLTDFAQIDVIEPSNNIWSTYDFESAVLDAYLYKQIKNNYFNNYAKDARVREESKTLLEQNKAMEFMYLILDAYDKQKKYPAVIPDGWHHVVAMNYSNVCREAKVLVEDNKVTSYVIDNWQKKEIKSSSAISQCKSSIELMKEKDKKSKNPGRKLDLYFMDYLIDPNFRATPPATQGKATFWIDPEVDGRVVVVYLDGEYRGKVSKEYNDSIPECGEKYTLTIEEISGTHDFRAYNDRNVWRGTIVIYAGECTLQILSESNTTVEGYK